MLISRFFDFIIADRMTGGFNESGVNSDAFLNAQPMVFKLSQDLGVDLIHSFFGESASKAREGRVVRGRLA